MLWLVVGRSSVVLVALSSAADWGLRLATVPFTELQLVELSFTLSFPSPGKAETDTSASSVTTAMGRMDGL